jgi:CheY-like chemotaxis protein
MYCLSPNMPDGMRKRVIVIGEDDEPIATLLQESISDEPGYRGVIVADGAEIINTLRAVSADLLILDIMMPGLDGFEVYDQVRADPQLGKMPILFLTAAATQYDTQLKQRNITDIVSKPFDLNQLIDRVRTLCAARDLAPN